MKFKLGGGRGLKASLLILSCAVLLGTASASWNNLKSIQSESVSLNDDSLVAVCYIGDKYYTDLGHAINVATSGNTIYVIPSLRVGDTKNFPNTTQIHLKNTSTTTTNYTLKSGVTLCLPYDGTTWNNRESEGTNFADANLNSIMNNMKTEVIIDSGVTLTISSGATVQIGGIIGNHSTLLAGETSQSYCQITMQPNSYITNSGTIDCYGYIKEYNEDDQSGGLTTTSTGKVIQPLVFYDYYGGNYTSALVQYSGGNATDGFFPINVFDLPNIQVKARYNYGSNLSVYVGVYIASLSSFAFLEGVSPHVYLPAFSFIGTDSSCLFQLNGGNYISIDYVPPTKATTTITHSDGTSRRIAFTVNDCSGYGTYGAAVTHLETHCSFNVNNLSINLTSANNTNLSDTIWNTAVSAIIGTTELTTANKFLPICYKWDFDFYEGTYNFPVDVRFHQGANIHIHSGATFNVSGDIVIKNGSSPMIPSSQYPTALNGTPTTVINDGVINVRSGGSLGGYIQTSDNDGGSSDGTITFENGANYSVTYTEYTAFADNEIASTADETMIATGDISVDGTTTTNQSFQTVATSENTNSFSSAPTSAVWEPYVSPIRQVTISYPYYQYTSALGVTFSASVDGVTYTQDDFSESTPTSYTVTTSEVGDVITFSGTNIASFTIGGTAITSGSYTILESDGTITLEIKPVTTIQWTLRNYGNMGTANETGWFGVETSAWRYADLYVNVKATGPDANALSLSTSSDKDQYQTDEEMTQSSRTDTSDAISKTISTTYHVVSYGTGSSRYSTFTFTATAGSSSISTTCKVYSKNYSGNDPITWS